MPLAAVILSEHYPECFIHVCLYARVCICVFEYVSAYACAPRVCVCTCVCVTVCAL